MDIEALSLPLSSLVLTERACSADVETWIAYLPRTLESLGWDSGSLSLAACPVFDADCCVKRRISGLVIDASHSLSGAVEPSSVAPLPRDLLDLEVASRCGCARMAERSRVRILGSDRVRLSAGREGRIGLAALTPPIGRNNVLAVQEIELAALFEPDFDAFREDVQKFPVFLNSLDRDAEGRLLVGTSSASVLSWRSPSDYYWTEPLGPGREASLVRARPAEMGPPAFVTLSREYASEFHVYEGGAWRVHGNPNLMRETCNSLRGSTQDPAILWLGPDEVLVQPKGTGVDMPSLDPVSHPHGFWHLAGDELRWVTGPQPQDGCLTALAQIPGYGVLAGTRTGQLYRWNSEGWAPLELLSPHGRVLKRGEVFEIGASEGGFLHTTRDGGLNYIRGDVFCESFVVTTQHLRSIARAGDEYLVSTDGRDSDDSGQVLRVTFE